MSSDAEYERDRREAAKDIREAGKRIWLVTRTRVGGTERSPEFEESELPVWVVELHQRLRNLDGSLAPSTAHTLLVSTEGLPAGGITTGDRFAFSLAPGAPRYSVLEPRPLRPGNVTILWEVDLGG